MTNAGESLALFQGECPAGGQLALDGCEIALRGLQRVGIVGRCINGCFHLSVSCERIPNHHFEEGRCWPDLENSLRYTQAALSNTRAVFSPTPIFFSGSASCCEI